VSDPNRSKPLAGRVALVTGVSRRQGIGAGLTRRLLADGASVFASGWEPHDAEMTWGADPGGRSALLEDLGGVGPSIGPVPGHRSRRTKGRSRRLEVRERRCEV